ncbi:hypothetical protein J2W23_002611 [Variovorax boronicumulans]|uniref:hypothetical protein n=1 Tax=Variovorax boronicumulans TaxID=436515 RepID=UPI0027891C2B|nr:hypothetical protein [Variovorax boronicumulans]MDQ0014220.1 hypothetical protein [Variovorax boronicumulans]
MTHSSTPLLLALLTAAALAVGCASTAVTDDAIVTNTSRALGLPPSAFTISNRADSGVQTTFIARTDGGRTYNCYVEGSVSVVGRVVSDAICQEMRQSDAPASARRSNAKPAPVPAPAPACNALLRAAGRC